MNDFAYDKLATRARELLSAEPRPSTVDVADYILGEVFDEGLTRAAFVERLRPAMVHIVSGARSRIVRDLEEAAVRPYLARSVNPPALPESGEVRHYFVETHMPNADSSDSERVVGDHAELEAQPYHVASPAPQDDGQPNPEAQGLRAVPAERGDGGGHENRDALTLRATPVTPLSLRMEVLDGWRALRDETMFVPEHGDVTYGTATVPQIDRAITYQHSRATASLDKARRLRSLRDLISSNGVACLDDVLDGRES